MDQPAIHSPWRRKALFFGAALGLVALDQWTKALVAAAMPLYSAHDIVPGFFRLVHTRNTGIAFSLLADSDPIIRNGIIPIISVAAVGLVIYLMWNNRTAAGTTHFGLCLILAGAAGNLYDRAMYGYVVDFLDFSVAGYHWPAFNVADSCITIGAGLVMLDALRTPAQGRQEAESA